jgi:hypothetical protein
MFMHIIYINKYKHAHLERKQEANLQHHSTREEEEEEEDSCSKQKTNLQYR